MKLAKFVIAIGLFTACGGGGSSIDIVGETPEVQSQQIADAICDQNADCGDVTITCETQTDCTGTIDPVVYQACYDENEPDIRADLIACNLTAEQEGQLEDCINAVSGQSCVTQAELDAYVVEIEAGGEPEPLRPIPASCAAILPVIEACSPPA